MPQVCTSLPLSSQYPPFAFYLHREILFPVLKDSLNMVHSAPQLSLTRGPLASFADNGSASKASRWKLTLLSGTMPLGILTYRKETSLLQESSRHSKAYVEVTSS